jgi:hypothetical protein
MRIRKALLVFDRAGRACLPIDEAARRKGFSPWALRKRIKQGAIATITVGGRTVIPLEILDQFEPDRRKIAAARKAAGRRKKPPP